MSEYLGVLKQRPLPSFIKKLWLILADESLKELIFWVDQGQVICVPNIVSFSQNILPRFFKHNNWQSFVRQLNLYGFKKVYQLNLAYDETLEKRIIWQFKHEFFRKDSPEKLCEIKRRTAKVQQQQQQEKPSYCLKEYKIKREEEYSSPRDNHETTFKEELQRLKLKLEYSENKRQELLRQIVELAKKQSEQQKTINAFSDFINELMMNNPQLVHNQAQLDRIAQHTPEQESNENIQYGAPIYPSTQELPSISSLMDCASDYKLPPLKRRGS